MNKRVQYIIDEVMFSIREDQDFKGTLTLMRMAIEKAVEDCAKIADQCREDEWFDVGGAIREFYESDE